MHPPIIVHSHLPWDFVWQRPQHIFSRLAAHHRILFLEEAEYGAERLALRISEPQAGIVRVIPLIPERRGVEEDSAAVLPLLRAALQNHPALAGEFDSPVQW